MQEQKKITDEKQLVIFSIGKEEFGVDIAEVREIIRIEDITKIPNTASHIKGVINLRGGIIVVVDLALKLGLGAKVADKNTRIIVIEVNENTIGMIVDNATEVLRLRQENIKPAPQVITKKIDSDYIEGVGIMGERLLILLDLAKVLEAKDMEEFQKIQAANTSPEVKPEAPQASKAPETKAPETKTPEPEEKKSKKK